MKSIISDMNRDSHYQVNEQLESSFNRELAKWKYYKDRKVANAIEEEPLANEEPMESESDAPPRRYMDNRVVES
jgi:hypothetical protein